jgi:hypothetical protein
MTRATEPPPELVQEWTREAHDQPPGPDARVIAARAAKWARDNAIQECCEWIKTHIDHWDPDWLAAHMKADVCGDSPASNIPRLCGPRIKTNYQDCFYD